MSQRSRRVFLKSASAAAAAIAVSSRIPAFAAQSGAPVSVWSSFRDRRHAASAPLAWAPVSEVAADAIALDPGTPRQEILGFGGALTDATCYVISPRSRPQRPVRPR